MHRALLPWPAAALALLGCAAQTPAEQLAPASDTVRVCEGSRCVDQHRSHQRWQPPAADAAAERRLEALSRLAAQDSKAAYDLGLRLLRGDGVARDSFQAIEWLRQAGDHGLVAAQLALGRIYLQGLEEMGADPAEAQAWLERAAAQGNKEAGRLLPQAQAAKRDAQAGYQIRAAERSAWGRWYAAAPYYWYWGGTGWILY